MPSDLHYTRDEVARLRADYDTLTSRTTGRVMDDLLALHDRVAAWEKSVELIDSALDAAGACAEVDTRHCVQVSEHEYEVDGEHRLAAPDERVGFLAAERDALRDAHAALREQADRMRAVLLALADGCDEAQVAIDRGPPSTFLDSIEDAYDEIAAAFDSSLPVDGDATWSDTARAIRALAEVPR